MSATTPPPPPVDSLPDDLAVCQQMIRELLVSLREQRQDNAQLRHRLDLLLRRLYGPRAERYDPSQPWLFASPEEPAPPAPAKSAEEPQSGSPRKRRGHGRRQLPRHLRREPIEYTLTEAERLCPCCGELRQPIGTTVTEQLDYEPASLFRVEHVRHAYACQHCAGEVVAAARPPAAVEGGLPGPGLLAHVVVSKYGDHLPLYRLERIFAREGVPLARSTLCDWMAAAARLLRPLYDDMVRRLLGTGVIATDDTPLPVQDERHARTRQGRLWVHVGDWLNPWNLFTYTPNHCQEGPQQFLQNFRGYLQADAYAGYDGLYATGRVVEGGCNAHARRKFYEARDNDPERAHRALAYYRQLYAVEEEIRAAEAAARQRGDPHDDVQNALFRVFWEEQVVQYRQEYALPIWWQFAEWLRQEQPKVLPKSALGEAFQYVRNQFTALTRYVWHGFLAIDNNVAEREMKRIAIGRKNWLFVGSDAGGETAAILFSFLSTCQRHGREPFTYLRDLFRRLPTHPPERLAELLPDRWQPLGAGPVPAALASAEPPVAPSG